MSEERETIKPNEELEKSLTEFRDYYEQTKNAYDNEADEFWNSLSKEDQLKCFYSVCKRIHEGEIINRSSYRHVLYGVFGFGLEAYTVGMDCGYFDIHNRLFTNKDLK